MTAPISRVTTGSGTGSASLAARSWAEGLDFSSAASLDRIEVGRAQAPTTGPQSLQRAHAMYQSWSEAQRGTVRLLQTQAQGQTLYALHTTTNGSEGLLEVHSQRGTLLASGTTGRDANGRATVQWDVTPGRVRERVAPPNTTPSVAAFSAAIAQASAAGSASGTTVSRQEILDATKLLVGPELTTSSVDEWERSSLLKVLAEAKLTPAARTYAEQLVGVATPAADTTLSSLTTGPLGQGSAFLRSVRTASASVSAAGAPPRLNTMTELSRLGFGGELPSQVVPVTRADALALLRAAGANATEARTAIDSLSDAKGQLFMGRSFEEGPGVVPTARGQVLFGVPSSGRELRALNLPVASAPVPPVVTAVTGPNERRAKIALEALAQVVIASQHPWSPAMVEALVRGIAEPRGADVAAFEGVLGVEQSLAAARTMVALPAPRRDALLALTRQAGAAAPELERALLYKAVAARAGELTSADDTVAASALAVLTRFAEAIRGQSRETLIDRTSVIDLDGDDVAEGLMQRFAMSCVPTSFQIVQAEADPVASWAMHEEPVASFTNPTGAVGEEQKRWLEAGGGRAVARPTMDGWGMWPERTIDQVLAGTTGHRFVRTNVSDAPGRAAALDTLAGVLERGDDVPFVAGPSTNHCMVFTDVRDTGGTRQFLIQDPWEGKSYWLSKEQLVNGNFAIGALLTASSLWILYLPAD